MTQGEAWCERRQQTCVSACGSCKRDTVGDSHPVHAIIIDGEKDTKLSHGTQMLK